MNPFSAMSRKEPEPSWSTVDLMAAHTARCLADGGTLYACGNGGSAEQANHLVAELVGRYEDKQRAGLDAISLCANTAVMTALANDFGFDNVFRRQLEAHGRPGDTLVVLSTSGASENVLRAIEHAKWLEMQCFAMVGYTASAMSRSALKLSDLAYVSPSVAVSDVQVDHLRALHRMAGEIERMLRERDQVTSRAQAKAG